MTLDRRISDALELEAFLGIPSGGHRDPGGIGGVQPRWPDTRHLEQRQFAEQIEGEVICSFTIDPKTLEMKVIDSIDDWRERNKVAIDAALPSSENAQS